MAADRTVSDTDVHLRDALLVVLAAAAGVVDVLAYLGLERVFTANMTGNMVLLGIAAGRGEAGQVLRSGVALAGFVAGVLAGALIGGPRARRSERVWPWPVTAALGVELLVLAGFGTAWAMTGGRPAGPAVSVLIAVSAVAMGIQSEAVRRLGVSGIATTYVTGTLTYLVADVALPGGAGVRRRGGVLLAVLAGAGLGAALTVHAARLAALAPALLLGAVVATAAVRYRRRQD